MKTLLITLLFIPLISTAHDCSHKADEFRCVQYLRNYDGDTVTFYIPKVHPLLGKKISIRVNDIDTPEMRTRDKCEKRLAKVAQKLVQATLSKAKEIHLKNVQRGKYFRIVADVYADGVSLKKIILKNRLAYPYDGGTKTVPNWCKMGL